MHLGHRVVFYARILLKNGFVLVVQPTHIDEHLSVDVLRTRDLVVVQLRHFEYVIHFIHQWRLDVVEISDYLDHLRVDIVGNALDFLVKIVRLLFELSSVRE